MYIAPVTNTGRHTPSSCIIDVVSVFVVDCRSTKVLEEYLFFLVRESLFIGILDKIVNATQAPERFCEVDSWVKTNFTLDEYSY